MNKSDLIQILSERSGLNILQAEELVNVIFKRIKDTLISGGRVEIRGFGSFVVKEYKPYQGRNPKTGEKIPVASKKLPFFKVGKELKDRINSTPSSSNAT